MASAGRAKHMAMLNEQGKENTVRQMETHAHKAKRRRSSVGNKSTGGFQEVAKDFVAELDVFTQVARHASLQAARTNAMAQWTRDYKLWKAFPDAFPDQGPREASVARAVQEHSEAEANVNAHPVGKMPTVSSEMEERFTDAHD
eukprot:scaffold613_cov325-Pavlova_lutheri.AAC.2